MSSLRTREFFPDKDGRVETISTNSGIRVSFNGEAAKILMGLADQDNEEIVLLLSPYEDMRQYAGTVLAKNRDAGVMFSDSMGISRLTTALGTIGEAKPLSVVVIRTDGSIDLTNFNGGVVKSEIVFDAENTEFKPVGGFKIIHTTPGSVVESMAELGGASDGRPILLMGESIEDTDPMLTNLAKGVEEYLKSG